MLEPIEPKANWTHAIECELCTTTGYVGFLHDTHEPLGPSLKAQLPPGWSFFKESPNRTAIMCPECSSIQTAKAKGSSDGQVNPG
jgi:hypothetical protein